MRCVRHGGLQCPASHHLNITLSLPSFKHNENKASYKNAQDCQSHGISNSQAASRNPNTVHAERQWDSKVFLRCIIHRKHKMLQGLTSAREYIEFPLWGTWQNPLLLGGIQRTQYGRSFEDDYSNQCVLWDTMPLLIVLSTFNMFVIFIQSYYHKYFLGG